MPATFSQVITADGSYFLCDTATGSGNEGFKGLMEINQTGTGTWKLQISPDGGTTVFDALNQAGGTITGASSRGPIAIDLPSGAPRRRLSLWLLVTGSSGLSLTPFIHAN